MKAESRATPAEIELSVVMPVYNEAENLPEVLEEARLALEGAPFRYEILLLDDASTDDSLSILRKWEARHPEVFRVLAHGKNQGIMGALETLFAAARGKWIFFNSSDGQFRTADCLKLMEQRDGFDIGVGYRTKKLYNLWRHVVSWSFNALTRLLFGVNTRDAGSIKLYRRETLSLPLLSKSPFREAERLIRASRAGFRLGFVPVDHLSRKGGRATGGHLKVVAESLWDCLVCALTLSRFERPHWRGPSAAADARFWAGLGAATLVGLAALMGATVLDYAPTWDEQLTRANGANWVSWTLTLGKDDSALKTLDLHLYGAFFDGLSYLLGRLLPLSPYDAQHAFVAVFGWLALLASYRLGSRLGGHRAGFLALLLLATVPAFYGHSFNNPKDIPFATCFLWAVDSLFAVMDRWPRPERRLLARLGLFIGLALAVRIGGLLLLGYLGVFWLAWVAFERVSPGAPSLGLKEPIRGALRAALIAVAVAWPVMLAFWPYAQVAPLANPFRALGENARFNFNPLLLFDGRWIEAKEVPSSYVPVWLLNTAPEALLLATGLAVFSFLFVRDRAGHLRLSLLAFCALFPIGVAIALKSTLYDGARHFLFVWPMLAVFAAAGTSRLVERSRAALPVSIAMAALVGITIWDMARLHPYQHYYFNRAVAGGVARASTRFDFDYWGNSLREGTEWLVANYTRPGEEPIRLATCGDWFQVRDALKRSPKGGRFTLVHDAPDVFLALPRENCHQRFPGRVIHSVTRLGATLLQVIEPFEGSSVASAGIR